MINDTFISLYLFNILVVSPEIFNSSLYVIGTAYFTYKHRIVTTIGSRTPIWKTLS